MRQPLVAGNWKMNGSKASVAGLLNGLKQGAEGITKVEIAVCPPAVFIPEVANALQGTAIAWGAQNVSEQPPGAFTGEIAAAMLLDFQCKYVIVGHSERRVLLGETDEQIARKWLAAKQAGLIPILCIGESLAEREQGVTESVVARQLAAVIQQAGIAAFADTVIAYEPVWAIGTGKTATSQQAQAVHQFIRNQLAALDAEVAAHCKILYGGSMKPDNAAELMRMPDIDGGLIGGASLQADAFLAICNAA